MEGTWHLCESAQTVTVQVGQQWARPPTHLWLLWRSYSWERRWIQQLLPRFFTTQSFMVEQQRENHCLHWSSPKDMWETPKVNWKKVFLVWWDQIKSCLAIRLDAVFGGRPAAAWWWQHHAVRRLLSSWPWEAWEGRGWNKCSDRGGQTWFSLQKIYDSGEDLFSSRTMTRSTQRESFKDNKVKVLERPSRSPDLDPTEHDSDNKGHCWLFTELLYLSS